MEPPGGIFAFVLKQRTTDEKKIREIHLISGNLRF